jgi:hypothetical protein
MGQVALLEAGCVEYTAMTDQLAENSVRTYHLPPEGFGRAGRKLLGQRVVLSVGVIAIVFAVQYKEFGDSWKGSSILSILAPIVVMVVMFGALAIGTANASRRNGNEETCDLDKY